MKNFFIILSLIISLTTLAAPQEIKNLVPAGYDLAFTYSDLTGNVFGSSNEAVLKFDFNKDGNQDAAILVEKTICLGDLIDGNCNGDFWTWGAEDRKLMIFFGSKDGSYKLFLETTAGILNQGEGGIASPEPLEEFSVSTKGTLTLSYWGGSSLKWGNTFRYQFRNVNGDKDFYVVGRSEMYMDYDYNNKDDVDVIINTLDHNLITGKKITSSVKMSDDSEKEITSYDKKPLVKLRDATDSFLFGNSYAE